eukprot:3619752-Lingulodinium_polyedra.AAC.1
MGAVVDTFLSSCGRVMMRASSVTFVGVARFHGRRYSCRMLGVVTPSPKPNPSASNERAQSKPQEEH